MPTAQDRGWGNPYDPDYSLNIVGVTAGGITVWVHRNAADVFRYLNTMLARKYNLAGFADDWAYCKRPIRGYEAEWAATHDLRYLSNHSWGLAEDLDASVNPMTTDLAAHHTFVREVVDPILAPFGGRLVWGGEYSGPRKDYMHHEYVGTPKQAIADSVTARRLLAALEPEDDTVTPEDRVAIAKLTADMIRKDLAVLLHGTKAGTHPGNLDAIRADTQAIRKAVSG